MCHWTNDCILQGALVCPNEKDSNEAPDLALSFFACPNGDCADFNRFDGGNLSVAEWMGKDKAIRRLYWKTCGTHFSE